MKKRLLVFLIILMGLCSLTPANTQALQPAHTPSPPEGPSAAVPCFFHGHVHGDNLVGKDIEVYINHVESPLTALVQSDMSFSVNIPTFEYPVGSTVVFKIDEQVYGFASLVPCTSPQIDLQLDEQIGH